MIDDIEKILFSKEEISQRVEELGKKISIDYENKNLIVIGLLKGSLFFMSDILRKIKNNCKFDFMSVSSYYGETKSTGNVKIIKDIGINIEDADVLIIEDIIDTGRTLNCVYDLLKKRNPLSLKICTLLDKPTARIVDINADYVGFKISDEFIVGYGLDYKEKYRNLPFIGTLKSYVYHN